MSEKSKPSSTESKDHKQFLKEERKKDKQAKKNRKPVNKGILT